MTEQTPALDGLRDAYLTIPAGQPAESEVIAKLPALYAAIEAVLADRVPHPEDPHEFRTVCQRCGERGFLNVALITDREVVRIEEKGR